MLLPKKSPKKNIVTVVTESQYSTYKLIFLITYFHLEITYHYCWYIIVIAHLIEWRKFNMSSELILVFYLHGVLLFFSLQNEKRNMFQQHIPNTGTITHQNSHNMCNEITQKTHQIPVIRILRRLWPKRHHLFQFAAEVFNSFTVAFIGFFQRN